MAARIVHRFKSGSSEPLRVAKVSGCIIDMGSEGRGGWEGYECDLSPTVQGLVIE